MKIFNKIKIHYILWIICLVGISFLIELFVFNFDLLTLEKDINGITEVSYKENVVDDKIVLSMDFDNLYVNKLRIQYETLDDIDYEIKYYEKDYYDGSNEILLDDIFDNEVNESISYLGNKIDSMEISYDRNSEIEIEDITIDNRLKINYFRIIFINLIIIASVILIKYYKNGSKNESFYKYFILIGLILGSAIIVLQPSATYYSWDDQIHFLNVYELAGGNLNWSVGETQMVFDSPVGRDSIDSMEEQLNQKEYLNSKDVTNYNTYGGRFITYNKIAYIPSAVGYYGGKLLGLPFDICFMLGKFMNLFVYLFIIGYAIKVSKVGKRLLAVLGLIPTSLFLACQYSYDAAVISGFVLAMVCLINWFVDKEFKVNFKNLFIFIIAMLYGCFPKAVYIPFMLLFLFIPTDRFRNKKESIYIKIGMLFICVLVMATFVMPVVSGGAVTGDARGGDTSVAGQLKVILEHPIGYLRVLNDTMIKEFINSFVGSGAIGSFAYIGNISSNLYLMYLILIVVVSLIDSSNLSINKFHKLLFMLVILGVVLLIWTALYLSFTPIGSNIIDGVQPRYFLPLLFPLLVCLGSSKFKVKISDKIYNFIVLGIPVIIIFMAVYQLILTNYCM